MLIGVAARPARHGCSDTTSDTASDTQSELRPRVGVRSARRGSAGRGGRRGVPGGEQGPQTATSGSDCRESSLHQTLRGVYRSIRAGGGGGRRRVSVSERGQARPVSSYGSRHWVVESGDGTANRLDISSGDRAATNGPPMHGPGSHTERKILI